MLELFGPDAERSASGGPMIDSSNADGRSDEEIVKSALAQTSPKPLLPNSMVLVVSGEKLSVSFNGVIGEMDAVGEILGSQNRLVKHQVALRTQEIENRTAEAQEMLRMEAFAANGLAPMSTSSSHIAGTLQRFNKFDDLVLWVRRVNPWLLIGMIALAPLARTVFWRIQGVTLMLDPLFQKLPLSGQIFVGSLFAPIVETILFQSAFLYVGRSIGLGRLTTVVLSSILFAMGHGHVAVSPIWYFGMGMMFSILYLSQDFDRGRPFLKVATAHGLSNTLVLLISASRV